MRPSWKLALIGGEITVLAAFTGIGIHLAMQPHRIAFRPPPLVLPTTQPSVLPRLGTPVLPSRLPSPPATSMPGLAPELCHKFRQHEHDLEHTRPGRGRGDRDHHSRLVIPVDLDPLEDLAHDLIASDADEPIARLGGGVPLRHEAREPLPTGAHVDLGRVLQLHPRLE